MTRLVQLKGHAMELDRFDRQLLALLQQNCRFSSEQLAERVGLSASAVQRRTKRLREQGIIVAEVAMVDPNQLPHLTFLVSIELERDNYPALEQFKQWIKHEAAVQQVFYVTGDVDLVAVVTATDTRDYDNFSERLMVANPCVRRMNSQLVLDIPKQGLYWPV
ncbi:Lrp/AsnC family transcriptional regulator [Celerinatantimonas sp. YJH-8]|uniref:Lrp/AsnC family transcriptional regulator n=1 Tax=Celerinatantimonas sp. YJH-8 TaxID=3228714 RepID=UPI0038C6DEF5